MRHSFTFSQVCQLLFRKPTTKLQSQRIDSKDLFSLESFRFYFFGGPKQEIISKTPPSKLFSSPSPPGTAGVRRPGSRNPLKSEKSRGNFAIDFPAGKNFGENGEANLNNLGRVFNTSPPPRKMRVFIGFFACFATCTRIRANAAQYSAGPRAHVALRARYWAS
jgi:hypothetical protein